MKSIIFLVISSPLIAEVFVSHNISLHALTHPFVWFWLIVSYGIPILFIREIWKRLNWNIAAVPVLGIAYGILNEGVLARTLTQTAGGPAMDFIGYGTVAGVHSTWATFILTWHALHSVLLPILLTHFLFHLEAQRIWLSRKLCILSGIITFALYSLYFGNDLGVSAYSTSIFLVYVAATVALFVLAFVVGKIQKTHSLQRSLPGYKYFIVSGAILPPLVYILAFPAAAYRFPPALVFVVLGWGLFAFLLKYVHKYEESPTKILAFVGSSGIALTLMTWTIFS
jgi:hypothetical protein